MSSRYDHDLDLTADTSHTRVLRLVGQRKRVLDLGCAAGVLARVLVERSACRVTGVERDAEAAGLAKRFCDRLVVGDLETMDLPRELDGARFDVIVCADVLEHLRDPGRLLSALPGLLEREGYVVASIPNVAYAGVIADLLTGHFRYRPLGLLDRTHIRFFTRHSMFDCFEGAGLLIVHLERLAVEPEATEFRMDLARVPADLLRTARSHDESMTYQFVVMARPGAAGGSATPQRPAPASPMGPDEPRWPPCPALDTVGLWSARFEGFVAALLGRTRFLEEERDRLMAISLRADRLEEECAREGRRAREVEEELDAVRATLGWQLLEAGRRWRDALVPPGSPRRRLYDGLFGRSRTRPR